MFVAIVFTLRCLLSDTVLFAFCQPEGIAEIRRSQNARFESDLLVDWVIELQAHWKKGAHKKRNKRKNKKTKEKNLVITHTFLFFFFFSSAAKHALEQSKAHANKLKADIGPLMKEQAGSQWKGKKTNCAFVGDLFSQLFFFLSQPQKRLARTLTRLT